MIYGSFPSPPTRERVGVGGGFLDDVFLIIIEIYSMQYIRDGGALDSSRFHDFHGKLCDRGKMQSEWRGKFSSGLVYKVSM